MTQEKQTRLAEIVVEAMDRNKMSIKALATRLDITYEHTRRMVKGETTPSKHILKDTAEILGINYRDLERLATADRIVHRFGKLPLELTGKNPDLEPMERLWPKLDAHQQEELMAMAQLMVKHRAMVEK
jgi:transcriptional regulator with XRE-family HTH domain